MPTTLTSDFCHGAEIHFDCAETDEKAFSIRDRLAGILALIGTSSEESDLHLLVDEFNKLSRKGNLCELIKREIENNSKRINLLLDRPFDTLFTTILEHFVVYGQFLALTEEMNLEPSDERFRDFLNELWQKYERAQKNAD